MTASIEWDRVAPFYDTYVQATFDIPFFLQETTKSSGQVLELMVGTGRVSLPLVRAGVQLTCVDNAPEMLARLRQKLVQEQLSAQVYEMDVRSLSFDKQFDLILLPLHSFSELISPTDRKQRWKGFMSIWLLEGGSSAPSITRRSGFVPSRGSFG